MVEFKLPYLPHAFLMEEKRGNMANQYKKWTKEEVIEAIKEFYKREGRTPLTRDFKSKNNLPSWMTAMKLLERNSIYEVLKLANIEYKKYPPINKIKDSELKKELSRCFKLYGGIPSSKFLNENCNISRDVYNNRFGGIKNACLEYGLINKCDIIDKNERIKNSISMILDFSYGLNRCIYTKEYDEFRDRNKTCSRRELERTFKLSFGEIIRTNTDLKQSITKKESLFPDKIKIKKDLIYLSEKLGRLPFSKELGNTEISGLDYSITIILKVFNTSSILDVFDELNMDYGKRNRGTMYTNDELINDFIAMYNLLGYIPYAKDFKKYISSYSTYINRFESLENLCLICDIPYKKAHNGAGKISFDDNGDICKSIPEKEITNYMISEGIKYEKEVGFSELFSGDNRRFDWVIYVNNRRVFVEYFWMYNSNRNKGIIKEYNSRTKKKIKDLYKLGFHDNCLFLFPSDYKNETYIQKINRLFEKEN